MTIKLDGKYRTSDGKYRVKRVLAVDVAGEWPVLVEIERTAQDEWSDGSPLLECKLDGRIRYWGGSGCGSGIVLVEEKRRYEGYILFSKVDGSPSGCIATIQTSSKQECLMTAKRMIRNGTTPPAAILPFSFEEGEGLEGIL